MKRTEKQAIETLNLNGPLLDVILKGATIISKKFNGWDWYFLVKYKMPDNEGFSYGQFETMDNIGKGDEFTLMVSRKGTEKQVQKKFNNDFYESEYMKNKAFALGNIK